MLAVELGHLGVAEDHVVGPLSEHVEGRLAVVRDSDLIAVLLERLGQGGGEVDLVVDDQDGLTGDRRQRRGRGGLRGGRRARDHGQLEAEGGPVSDLAFDRDGAVVLLERAPTEREAEPGPLTLGLRREEGLEDPPLNLEGNPGPAVRDLERDSGGLALEPGREHEPPRCFDRTHGLNGVGDQIHDDLLHLVTVGPRGRHVVRQVQHDVDVAGAQIVAE